MVDRFARVTSIALSPLLLPTIVTSLVLLDIGSEPIEIIATGSIVVVCLFAVPLADIVSMVRRGKTPTLYVPNQWARTEPFAIAVISGSAAVMGIRALGMHGEPLIHVILITYVINIVLVMGINVAWKISVHMAGLGGSIAILWLVSGLSGDNSATLTNATVLPLLLLIPLVGWARYQVKAHTIAQIAVGTVVGFCGHWLAMLAQVGR